MASTYALPVSLPHGHMHAHAHSHSHSHSSLSPSKLGPGGPPRSPNPRGPLQERSNGSSHSHMPSNSVPSFSHSHAYSAGGSVEIYRKNGLNGAANDQSLDHGSYSPYASDESSPALASHNHHERDHHDHCDHDHHDDHDHDHDHHHHSHDHDHDHHHPHPHSHSHTGTEKRSFVTNFLLNQFEGSTLFHSIMVDKDSRRIFYFMTLNFAFMTIQAFYGLVTDSLGLLSDSIHMFFDCLALALGLFAAVASKWPPSERFPYGFGKIESLSGFGNGVFLMLISIEIMIEAAERLAEGHETKRLKELFIVSTLGLLVNLVGMACFGHHHHGHDHSHGGHDHSHAGHDHGHHHDEKEKNDSKSGHNHSHGHGHDHDNENMRGIYLHVLADTMGSASVIVSTALMSTIGWAGWDPLASIFIAVLIFLSSIPLVTSSARKLLLTIPDDTEYQLRNTLAGISELRGVASYHVPRFWLADKPSEGGTNKVLGAMHIIATRGCDLDDLKERARAFLSSNGVDVVIQVEREGDGRCWCGGDATRTPSAPSSRF